MEAMMGAYALFMIFAVILGILWFFLPFAVFGMKPKLDLVIQESRATNARLDALVSEQSATRAAIEQLNATLLAGLRPAVPRPAVPPAPR